LALLVGAPSSLLLCCLLLCTSSQHSDNSHKTHNTHKTNKKANRHQNKSRAYNMARFMSAAASALDTGGGGGSWDSEFGEARYKDFSKLWSVGARAGVIETKKSGHVRHV
jgi:hypothetical protein